ncbi:MULTISPECIES: PQQ-dependent sugar dehydrogenase [Psychrobacter]|uniref:Glucose dehydrogenase n=1 Tax=Psychrobacter alimentarius TaxID=261164 RepID=A0ABN4N4Z1_9GAMM|nr:MULTISPECIES: PQQ-dependent sugar dehydrogenase [Psychrobacter]AMT97325.1 glucose dehydrogenase [Psychrobacter alimentarius]QCB30365.1 PQQ-dependent sugar dehydrogenase [Psychrobacter sp. PAMC27889]
MTTINKRHISTPLTLPIIVSALLFSTAACSNQSGLTTSTDSKDAKTSPKKSAVSNEKPEFTTKTVATFDEPWAMVALPKSNNASLKFLVTQKTGELFIVDTATGAKTEVTGIPSVAYGGQGGLGDITVAPDFATSNNVYISYAEAGKGTDSNKFGAKVIKAKLSGLNSATPSLQNITPIWQQTPKVTGQGHYSHRLLFSPDGQYLYISSGERQKKDPAQDMSMNLGKIIRLHPDGSVPKDNPFVSDSNKIASQFWTVGNRNVLGMRFDENGKLWISEMGPKDGDEFNLIEKGKNYGWPIVSNGRNYSGTPIPDHDTRPEFAAPKVTWTPVISPSSMSLYTAGTHNDFPAWQGDFLVGGLSSKALVVVDVNNNTASERYRYDMGERIRSVLTVDGKVWVLEDENDSKLLQLIPK